jgi:DNA-binding MarR family transcriptional regulator
MSSKKLSHSRVIAASEKFIRALARTTGDDTMGAQQQLMLLALYTHGSINQLEMSNFTGVEKSANSRNIARLGAGSYVSRPGKEGKVHVEGLGLLESVPDPMDRRFNLVRLTEKGRTVLDQVAAEVAPFFALN